MLQHRASKMPRLQPPAGTSLRYTGSFHRRDHTVSVPHMSGHLLLPALEYFWQTLTHTLASRPTGPHCTCLHVALRPTTYINTCAHINTYACIFPCRCPIHDARTQSDASARLRGSGCKIDLIVWTCCTLRMQHRRLGNHTNDRQVMGGATLVLPLCSAT